MERELRRFVRVSDRQPEWLWEAETVKLVRAVRPKLQVLDELRCEGVTHERE